MRIMTCSDHIDSPTGFGTQHRIVARALATAGHEVISLGIWDSRAVHQDMRRLLSVPLGAKGIEDATEEKWAWHIGIWKPDALITLGDPWMFQPLFEAEERLPFRWLHWLPVDGGGYPTGMEWDTKLVKPDWLVFMSAFGEVEYRQHVEGRVRIANIAHGVDTSIFRPVRKPEKARLRAHWQERLKGATLEGRRVLLNWDTNQWRKNQPALLQMLSYLPEEYVLVLHCSEAPRPNTHGFELAKLAQHRYGVGERVFFTGRGRAKPAERRAVSAERLATLIQAADLRVSATTGEGFGIPSIEAMACGVPVVITDCTTSREILGNGKCGRLAACSDAVVQPGTWVERYYVRPLDMARKVADLMGDPRAYAKCRRAGIRRVAQWYTKERIGEQWVDLMKDIN